GELPSLGPGAENRGQVGIERGLNRTQNDPDRSVVELIAGKSMPGSCLRKPRVLQCPRCVAHRRASAAIGTAVTVRGVNRPRRMRPHAEKMARAYLDHARASH